jgi:hypothetical protein
VIEAMEAAWKRINEERRAPQWYPAYSPNALGR